MIRLPVSINDFLLIAACSSAPRQRQTTKAGSPGNKRPERKQLARTRIHTGQRSRSAHNRPHARDVSEIAADVAEQRLCNLSGLAERGDFMKVVIFSPRAGGNGTHGEHTKNIRHRRLRVFRPTITN